MRKMILQSGFVLILLAMVSVSCKKDDDNDPTPTPTPTPTCAFAFFKVGSSWTYNVFDSDDPAVIINETYTIQAIDNNFATVKWELPGFTYTVEWYADNSIFSNLASKALNRKLTMTTANPQVGDSWSETYQTNSGTITNTETIAALNETVTVEAGTFTNCIKIRETTSDDPVYYKMYWFSKEYGIIKTEGTTTEDYPTIIYSELKSKI